MNYFIEFEDEDQLQLETPYAARLVAMRHRVLKLTEQRRFRPVFAEWLNHRVYGNET